MFSKWNKGLIDRFKESYVNYDGSDIIESPEDVVEEYAKKIFNKAGYEPFGYNIELINRGRGSIGSAFKLFLTLDEDIISQNVSIATEFYKYLQTYINSEDPKYSSPLNGFIPISLGITMDGMSGIKIYNSIDVDTRFLPPNYGKNLNFIIRGVNHKLSNQDWETNLETLVTAKSEEVPGKKYPYIEIKKYTDKLLQKYKTTSTSKTSNKKPFYTDVDYTAVGRLNPSLIKSKMIQYPIKNKTILTKGRKLMTYFQSQLGITKEMAAGLVGNLYAESGLQPNRYEGSKSGPLNNVPNGRGYGYAQWTVDTRKLKLKNFTKIKQKSYDGSQLLTDLQNQEFIVHEFKTSFAQDLTAIKSSNQLYPVQDSTLIILQSYENPAFIHQEPDGATRRMGYAFQFLGKDPQ